MLKHIKTYTIKRDFKEILTKIDRYENSIYVVSSRVNKFNVFDIRLFDNYDEAFKYTKEL